MARGLHADCRNAHLIPSYRMMTYEATFRINVGQAIPAIGDMLKHVNDGISSAGYDEKLSLSAELFSFNLTVNRELDTNEIHKMKVLIEAQVISAFPKYDIRLAEFRRQSGNVSQSVS